MNDDNHRSVPSSRIVLWSIGAAVILLSFVWFLVSDAGLGFLFGVIVPIIICVLVFVRTVLQWVGFVETGDEWQDWRSKPLNTDTQPSDLSPPHSEHLALERKWPRKSRFGARFRKSLKERFRWASDRYYNRND